MVGSHQSLLLVAPLEEREVDDPKALEHILVAQAQTIAHLQSQGTELDAGLVGIVAAQYQHEVAILGTHHVLDFCQHLRRIELIDATLHGSVGIVLDVYQALGTHLWALHEVGQLVELLSAVVSATRHTDTTDILSLVEHREATLAREGILQLHKLHAEAQVWLVATETLHRLVPSHLLQLRQFYATNLLEQVASHLLEEVDYVVLVYEAHLAVYLGELRLAVGAQVLVAEALGYLEVAVETSYHQELLQGLRALREGVELSWVHARRHHEVACALRCTTDEDRCFHLHEILAVEEVANQDAHTVAQLQVLAHGRASQVEIAIFHAYVVAAIGVVLDGERRSLALREHIQFLHQDFDVASIHLRILALSLTYCTFYLNTIFTTQLVGSITQFLVVGLVEDQLCDAITVAQVDECHATHLS